jgi:hypothetical protein
MQAIDTRRVTNRRRLRFETIDDLIAEMDRIVEADGEGRLRANGNWTPGQILAHLAAWIEYGYTGYPLQPPPWIVRQILRWQIKKYLRDGMPAGIRIPRVEGGTFGMDEMATPAAADRLKQALLRLQHDDPAPFDSPGFGPMSHADRVSLNLRHAELHLGFVTH